MRTVLDEQRPNQGAGIRFLTETIISPSLGAQMNELLRALPQAKWHQYEPANRDNARAGAVVAFGQPVNTTYRFDLAQRVLSIDSDFLAAMPGTLRYAREFYARRRVTEKNREMNRLYVIESTPSNTGACADHAWAVKPSRDGSDRAARWRAASLRNRSLRAETEAGLRHGSIRWFAICSNIRARVSC